VDGDLPIQQNIYNPYLSIKMFRQESGWKVCLTDCQYIYIKQYQMQQQA
jgi:hypothetical protein